MKSLTWNIGKIAITSIVEIECGSVIHEVIPNATKENIKKIPWSCFVSAKSMMYRIM